MDRIHKAHKGIKNVSEKKNIQMNKYMEQNK